MTFASNDRSPDVCVRFRDLDIFTAMLVELKKTIIGNIEKSFNYQKIFI